MSGEHYTLTISQSTSDNGDFAIHLKDRNRGQEHFLVHIRFPEPVIADESLMDDIVGLIAKSVAKRLLGQQLFNETPLTAKDEEQAEDIVLKAIERARKK